MAEATATSALLGPDRAFTVAEWIGDDGAGRVLGTEGEPTTPTMFVPLREETP